MPCYRCMKAAINAPDIKDWGPAFWSLLHGYAERSGKHEDEKSHWICIFEALPTILPCPECGKHVKEWLRTHPIGQLRKLPVPQLYGWITTYLYNLHENVNKRLGKPGFPKDKLAETYGSIKLPIVTESLRRYIEKSIISSGTGIISWKKMESSLLILRIIYQI